LAQQAGGDMVLLGGQGDDIQIGSPGRDLLIGGIGSNANASVVEVELAPVDSTWVDFGDLALSCFVSE
jgi:hypothetical protein